MIRYSPTPADRLTLARLLALPALWGLAVAGLSVPLGLGLALAGLTDVLDGPVARRTGRTSRFGSQLDSVADVLLMGSVLIWMAWLRPEFFHENAVPLLVWATTGVAALLATLIRFGRLGNLHLYSAKVAGVVGHLFAVWLFVFDEYAPIFFAVTVTVAILAAAETLLVALTRRDADERVGSILGRLR